MEQLDSQPSAVEQMVGYPAAPVAFECPPEGRDGSRNHGITSKKSRFISGNTPYPAPQHRLFQPGGRLLGWRFDAAGDRGYDRAHAGTSSH